MLSTTISTFLFSLGGVILVDLILSGDNALVIGTVASRIPERRKRWIALAFGGVVAIALRVLFTVSATFLLSIAYLQAVGGLLVLVIAGRLVLEETGSASGDGEEHELPSLARRTSAWIGRRMTKRITPARWNFFMAIVTIAIADLTMSLDNIIAIGALAHRQPLLIIIGLCLSIVLLVLGSAFIAELVERIPGLLLLTGLILAWVAADLIWADIHGLDLVNENTVYLWSLRIAFMVLIFLVKGIHYWLSQRAIRKGQAMQSGK